jgi:hypothetical protein
MDSQALWQLLSQLVETRQARILKAQQSEIGKSSHASIGIAGAEGEDVPAELKLRRVNSRHVRNRQRGIPRCK